MSWFLVFLLSLSISAFFINLSATDWAENPVSTDIETLPISDIRLPGITVCPPKGSHTALNYDLVKAENITLSKEDREEMFNVALDLLIEEDLETVIDNLESFVEEDRPRNWYEEQSTLLLPGNSKHFQDQQDYLFVTSATSGSVSTPWIGEDFNEQKFRKDARWTYEIRLYKKYIKQPAGKYFVLNLNIDISDLGFERLTIYMFKDEPIECPSIKCSENITLKKSIKQVWQEATKKDRERGAKIPEYFYVSVKMSFT